MALGSLAQLASVEQMTLVTFAQAGKMAALKC
jgi:hypothetical protein